MGVTHACMHTRTHTHQVLSCPPAPPASTPTMRTAAPTGGHSAGPPPADPGCTAGREGMGGGGGGMRQARRQGTAESGSSRWAGSSRQGTAESGSSRQ